MVFTQITGIFLSVKFPGDITFKIERRENYEPFSKVWRYDNADFRAYLLVSSTEAIPLSPDWCHDYLYFFSFK